ncbi:MFS transporter [Ralstonia sp.]|uniref:MFS transporter n=1 Tax=Ralstonia sp. TaxID=54061 RepID=UPI002C2812FA|nr:MFS transporter [Ralstonia sp.]HWV04577.1 MFS transporter [Ralstonia sp.]
MTPDLRAAHANSHREMLKVVIATSLVTCLELFDFTVFSYFAVMIGDQFFPATDPMTSLLLAVGTFGVGFFMRPLGAMMIGAYADRVSRRAAMTITIWLTAIGTAAIAVCPPFAVIGAAAPFIIIVGRLLQGFAAGGEVGTAVTFAMETAPPSRSGILVSWQYASQAAAALLGALLGTLLTSTMSPASLTQWGWRIPFLIGLSIVPAGLYLRRRLVDSPVPAASNRGTAIPFVELCREHGGTLALATLTKIWSTVPVYAVITYMPSYVTRVLHMPPIIGFMSSTLSTLLLVVVSPLSGLLADRLPRRKPMVLITSGTTAVLAYPVFAMMTHAQSPLAVLLGSAVISVLLALGTSIGALLVLEAFPARVRASGFAISHALGITLFGGTAQFIITGLIKWTGDPVSAAWYVAPACLVSFFAVLAFKERRAAA